MDEKKYKIPQYLHNFILLFYVSFTVENIGNFNGKTGKYNG